MRRLSSIVVVVGALILPLSAGCEKQPPNPPAAQDGHGAGGHEHEHAHSAEGPHHGQLIELGNEEYHAELIHDDAAHKITVYVLDSAAKEGVAIEAEPITINLVADGKPAQFSLPAAPQESDPAGKSSRFEVIDETLAEAMDAPTAKGRLNISIGGKPFSGTIGGHDHH